HLQNAAGLLKSFETAPVALQHQKQLGVHRVRRSQLCLVGTITHAIRELARIVSVIARECFDGLLASFFPFRVQFLKEAAADYLECFGALRRSPRRLYPTKYLF